MSLSHTQTGPLNYRPFGARTAESSKTRQRPVLDVAWTADPTQILAEWRALHAAHPTTPFHGHVWASFWSAHIANTSTHQPVIVTGRSADGVLQMVLPLALRRHGPLRILSWLGVGHGSHFSGLFAPELLARLDPAAKRQLGRDILAALPPADCLVLFDQPSKIGAVANPLVGRSSQPAVDNAYMAALDATGQDQANAHLTGRMRRKLRRRHRRLSELGTVQFDAPVEAGDRAALFDALCDQKTKSLEQRGIRSFLGDPRFNNFYRALATFDDEYDGTVHICGIRLNGQLIAANLGLIHDRTYHGLLLSTSDDPMVRPCAPGHLLIDQMITDLGSAGVTGFNLGAGISEFKRRWCNQEIVLSDTLIAMTPAGHLAVPAIATYRKLKRAAKQSPRAMHWFAVLRDLRRRLAGS